jgi:hypothetical protein
MSTRISEHFQALHDALAAACHKDLPNHNGHRPTTYDVEVVMFPQTWGNGSLGYGGMGTTSMVKAYTVLVHKRPAHYAVYFGVGGRLAYLIDSRNFLEPGLLDNWVYDLQHHRIASVKEAETRYLGAFYLPK